MTTATLTTSTLASAPSSATIGLALKQLGVAALDLTRALWTAFTATLNLEKREPTAQESAQALRVFASSIAASDPGFANDLFAAADRHEFGDNS
jgi:hypothetical protein